MPLYFFLILCFSSLWSQQTLSQPPQLQVEAYILIDEKGNILAEKNSHRQLYPASLTKVATALWALKKGVDMQEVVEVQRRQIGSISPEKKIQAGYQYPSFWIEKASSHVGLKTGEKVQFQDLFYGLLLESGNDAANVIASHVGGSIENFLDELNAYLKAIGCQNTHFNNPHGLHHPQHFSSAYDLALMTKEALSYPAFKKAIKTLVYTKAATNKQKETHFFQGNRLLKKGKYYYPYATGVKTGGTKIAKANLIAAAQKDDQLLILVLLKAPKFSIIFKEAKDVFEWAYSKQRIGVDKVDPLKPQDSKKENVTLLLPKGSQDYWGYKNPSGTLAVSLKEELKVIGKEKNEVELRVSWMALSYPIHKGSLLGIIEAVDKKGKVLASQSVYADESKAKAIRSLWPYLPPSLLFAVGFMSLLVLLSLIRSFKRP